MHHLPLIKGVLYHRAPEIRGVPWVEIDGRSETEVDEILRESVFFLSMGYREGLGLPPLEAMACGAIPVGFTAGGGVEYATRENGFWAPDENPVMLADMLLKLLVSYQRKPEDPFFTTVRQAGFATAVGYSAVRESAALIDFCTARAARLTV